ncbi:hypothetical protein ACFE04_005143 [Oxalis oulophora]
MKANLRGKYGTHEASTAAATLAVNVGDCKLKASLTDATFTKAGSLNGVVFAFEKPGAFIINYDVPKNDVRFHFMNTVRIAEKPLNLSYMHMKNANRTVVDGTFVVDSANKLSASYTVGTPSCKLKYTYVLRGLTTFEQSYDLDKSAWDFAISRKVYDDDVLRATYQTSSQVLGLDWTRSSKLNGNFKIAASVNLSEEQKKPKLIAETSWNFDIFQ